MQFLRCRVWPTEIGNYGSLFVLLPTPAPPYSPTRLKLSTISEILNERHNFLSFWAIISSAIWTREVSLLCLQQQPKEVTLSVSEEYHSIYIKLKIKKKKIKPKKNTTSIPHSEKQCISFPQPDPSPGLMFSKPGIQNMHFHLTLNKTFWLTPPPPPTSQQFKHSKLQNKKIRPTASAPDWFSTEGLKY